MAHNEKDEIYRSVVEDLTEVISRLLPDGTFVFVNEVYCRLFGKTSEELLGKRWHPVAHPDDLPLIEASLREMLPDNPVVTIENRVFVAGGELRWMQFVNRGFFDSNGSLKEIQSVGRDITHLKQIEARLLESQERLEMALAGSRLVLWDWDIQTHEVVVGSRWFDMLGYANDELGAKEDDWFGLIHPHDIKKLKQGLAASLAGDTAIFQSQHRLRHKEGHWVEVEASGKVTQRDKAGAPLRMVGTLLDITQRKRLNEEGVSLLKQIESLIREASSGATSKATNSEALETLTKRQRQILGMIAAGKTSAQIGKHLNISTNTVISHRRNLMRTLNLHSTAEVTRFAIDQGLMKQN